MARLNDGGTIELSPKDRALLANINAEAAARTADREQNAKAQVLARFERRRLTVDTGKNLENSTSMFRAAAAYVLEVTKPGREQSLALTALEEAKFWTNQSLALNGTTE